MERFIPPEGMAHAPAAPSSMAQIVQCPGSLQLQQLYPETEQTEEARAGDAAHWCMERGLTPDAPAVNVGDLAPNGVVIDVDMLEGPDVLIDHVIEVCGAHWKDLIVVERPVSIPRVHPSACWGRPDVRAWLPGFHLHVWDYKHGHDHIEVHENWQLMAYACGLIDEPHIKAWGKDDQNITVHLHVVQPFSFHRDGPRRTWTCNGADLRGYVNRMQMAVAEALSAQPTTRTGAECKHCTARHACPTLQRVGLSLVDMAGGSVPLELPPHAMGNELLFISEAIERLKARQSGLEIHVDKLLRSGQSVPHYGLVNVQGRARWTKPDADIFNLGALFGKNLQAPAKPVTPNQAAKLGIDATVISAYSEPSRSVKLQHIPESTARKAFASK